MAEVTQPGLYHTAGSAHLEGIDFAGKTGTAQQMSHEALEKTNKGKSTYPNVWFVGVMPRRNPELGGGGALAERRIQLLSGAHRRQGGGGLRGQEAAPGAQPAAAEGRGAGRSRRRVVDAWAHSPARKNARTAGTQIHERAFLCRRMGRLWPAEGPVPHAPCRAAKSYCNRLRAASVRQTLMLKPRAGDRRCPVCETGEIVRVGLEPPKPSGAASSGRILAHNAIHPSRVSRPKPHAPLPEFSRLRLGPAGAAAAALRCLGD